MNKRQKKKLKKKQQTALAKSNQAAKNNLSKGPAASSVVACSSQTLPPPKVVKPQQPNCKTSVTECALKNFIEVKCQHGGGKRKASEVGKVLEVVPAESGDTTSLKAQIKGGCGEPPEWEISGFLNKNTKAAETKFNALGWFAPPGLSRWIAEIVPRTYRVRAGTICQGMTESIEVRVYPADKLSLEIKEPDWLKELKERFLPKLEYVLGKGIELKLCEGSIKIEAAWEEYDDYQAYYGYDISIGLNPLLELGSGRHPFGALAIIPSAIRQYIGNALFWEAKGEVTLNGHWKRTSPEKRSAIADIKCGLQLSAGVEIRLVSEKIIETEATGNTGIEGSAETDPEAHEIQLKLKVEFSGFSIKFTIKGIWGLIEHSQEYQIFNKMELWDGTLNLTEGLKSN